MQVLLSTFWSCRTWWRWLEERTAHLHHHPAKHKLLPHRGSTPANFPFPARGTSCLMHSPGFLLPTRAQNGQKNPQKQNKTGQSPRHLGSLPEGCDCLVGLSAANARLYLNVPLSTSWPLRRMWMPSLRREPNAMYSARAQSTVLFFTISPRVFRIRLKPAGTEGAGGRSVTRRLSHSPTARLRTGKLQTPRVEAVPVWEGGTGTRKQECKEG